MNLVFQTLLGAAGSVGFALLFNIRGVKLAWIGAGGALGWVVYSLTSPRGGVFAAEAANTPQGERKTENGTPLTGRRMSLC